MKLQRFTLVTTLIYAAIFIGMLIVRPGTRHFYDAFFNTYQIAPPLFAGIVGLIFYRTQHQTNRIRRIGWLLIALACLSFTFGQATWTYWESIRGIKVPFPGWPDVGYIGNYLLMIPGVFLLSGSIPAAKRARLMFDSAILAASMGVLSWCFIGQRLLAQSEVSLLGKVISIAYPLGDIVSLFGAFVLLSSIQKERGLRRSLYFLTIGIFGLTFFDTTFTWMSLNGTYQTGSWSDWAISFGWILIAYSFLSQMWWPSKTQADSTNNDVKKNASVQSIWQITLPYCTVAAALLIVNIYEYATVHTICASVLLTEAVLMLLVVVRQVFALFENRILTLELQAFNDNLEELVEQRTKELEDQNREILAVIEERNRFYRHVSHEVRTPLTSVIGYAVMMVDDKDEPLTPWQKKQLDKVIGGAHKLLDTINCLLDITKIESNRMELNFCKVNLDCFLRKIVDNTMPLATGKSLQIKMDIASDLPDVVTDEHKLTQIFINLLSNAIKYTENGGSIHIQATANSNTFSICVEDNGVGIPEEELENIFKEFYRVPNHLRQQGSGLGLAIVQKFVGVLGGIVSVQSQPGVGTSFTVTLPAICNCGVANSVVES